MINIRHREKGTEHEYAAIDVGGHTFIVSERDGDPHLYLCDHATIRVEGEYKYETMARMNERDFVGSYTDVFEKSLRDNRLTLEISDDSDQVRTSWMPLNVDEDQMGHELEMRLQDVLRRYRR